MWPLLRTLGLSRLALLETAASPMPSSSGQNARSLPLLGSGRQIADVLRQVERYAAYDDVVLLEGESGTGKSALARYLHECSRRRNGRFEWVLLSALDDCLAASDLFGHVRGAYTDARHTRAGRFAQASDGTLFLDEIGKASALIQQKLLHVVEYGEVWPVGSDCSVTVRARLVAATNVALDALVATNAFLEDLYARLAGFRIKIPPLRDRRDDIPQLVTSVVQSRFERCGYREPPTVAGDLMEILQSADWPGNLRQLDAVLRRIMIDAEGSATLRPNHFQSNGIASVEARNGSKLSYARVRDVVERSGTITAAARVLGVSRVTVYKYLSQSRVGH